MADAASMPLPLRVMKVIRDKVDFLGRWGSLFIIPLVLFTMWDVFSRKAIIIQIFLVENVSQWFSSTFLQELEWHMHTALFALVLGYGYVHNRHVRVDLIREHLNLRAQAWIEFIGVTFFMIPYTLVLVYFSAYYAHESFLTNEISASLVGLSNRWIIKSVLCIGLISAAFSGLAIWIQSAMVLFGPKDLRFELMTLEWPEDVGAKKLAVDLKEEAKTFQ
jgi:TRAP-type mannitol/chloroaromatic compound transport system permease small subunit